MWLRHLNQDTALPTENHLRPLDWRPQASRRELALLCLFLKGDSLERIHTFYTKAMQTPWLGFKVATCLLPGGEGKL